MGRRGNSSRSGGSPPSEAHRRSLSFSGGRARERRPDRDDIPASGRGSSYCARGLRWLLTGEKWNAHDAFETGLVSEVVPAGQQLERAIERAERIACNAPLAVRSALAGYRAAERAARDSVAAKLREDAPEILSSQDVVEGIKAMLERRDPAYQGR